MSTDVFSKLKDSLFRSVPDVYLDLQTMKAGVKVGDGIVTLDVIEPKQEGGEKQYELKINQLVDFAVPVPAWATRTTIDALSLGDIIILDNAQLAFFLKKAENANVKNPSIVALQASDRSEVTVNLATNNLFGQIGLLAVRNAFGQTDGDMGNMLPLLLSDGEGDDFSRMMAMMAMMNANNNGKNGKKGDNPMAQMLPLLFMKDGVAGGDMQKLAMLSMLTGGGGNNPMMGILMAKMFAGKGAPAALPAK